MEDRKPRTVTGFGCRKGGVPFCPEWDFECSNGLKMTQNTIFEYVGEDLNPNHGCQMAIAGFLESYVFGPSGFWTMAPLRCAAKFDPFLSLDCAGVEGVGAQSKEGKGSNFAAQRSGAIVLKA